MFISAFIVVETDISKEITGYYEVINDYNVDISIMDNGSLFIKEEIEYLKVKLIVFL